MLDWDIAANVAEVVAGIAGLVVIFYVANARRWRILFHVNAVLNELQRLESEIDGTVSFNSTELRFIGKQRDIRQMFHTMASDALVASGIVHMLPGRTYDLFCRFYERLEAYDVKFCDSTPGSGDENAGYEKLVKMLKELRCSLNAYKREHERKREILYSPFKQLGLFKFRMSNNKSLLIMIIVLIIGLNIVKPGTTTDILLNVANSLSIVLAVFAGIIGSSLWFNTKNKTC